MSEGGEQKPEQKPEGGYRRAVSRSTTMGELRQIGHYKVISQLGAGAYAKVVLAHHIDRVEDRFAIKVVSQEVLLKRRKRAMRRPNRRPGGAAAPTPAEDLNDPLNMMKREIAIMKKLDHKNVVKLVEVLEDPNTHELFLVMEFVPGGTVMPEEQQCEPIPEEDAWRYFRSLVDALDYCHTNGVIHCDIKPANLLVTESKDIKVADFGTSRVMEESPENRESHHDDTVSKVMGTAYFLSPQACKGGSFAGKPLDIWAAGVTLYFMLFGKCPFEGEGLLELYEAIQTEPTEFPDLPEVSDDVKDLILKLTEKDDNKRIKIKEIMKHPWVTKHGKFPLGSDYTPMEVTQQEIDEALSPIGQMYSIVHLSMAMTRRVRAVKSLKAKRAALSVDIGPYRLRDPVFAVLQPPMPTAKSVRSARQRAEGWFCESFLRSAAPLRFQIDKLRRGLAGIREEIRDMQEPPANPGTQLGAFRQSTAALVSVGERHSSVRFADSNGSFSTTYSLESQPAESAHSPPGAKRSRVVPDDPHHHANPSPGPGPGQGNGMGRTGSNSEHERDDHAHSEPHSHESDGPKKRARKYSLVLEQLGVTPGDIGLSAEVEASLSHGMNLTMIAQCTHSTTALYSFNSVDSQSVDNLGSFDRPRAPDHPSEPIPFIPESVFDFATAYKTGTTTPTAVATRIISQLALCRQCRPDMSAVTMLVERLVLDQAEASTARWKSERPLSVMDGVPVVVSGNIAVKGHHRTDGVLRQGVADEDAHVVQKLRLAGVLIIGTALIQDLNLGLTGLTRGASVRNPHNLKHCAGGAATGAAAAVAMGLCPIALAVDECGSARVAAAMCGVVCLKPTFGRVGLSGVMKLAPDSAHICPIAQTVTDAAIAYALVAGFDPDDEASQNQPRVTLNNFGAGASLRSMRVGLWEREWFTHADAPVNEACAHVLAKLAELEIEPLGVGVGELELVQLALMGSVSANLADYLRLHPEALRHCSDGVQLHAGLANLLTPDDLLTIRRYRFHAVETLKKLFRHTDLLITPTTPALAPEYEAESKLQGPGQGDNLMRQLELSRFCLLASLTGFPCISIPVGYDEETGLPVSVMMMSKPWHESIALRVARVLESSFPRRRPEFHFTQLPF